MKSHITIVFVICSILVGSSGCATFSPTRSWYGYDLSSESKMKDQNIAFTITELQKNNILINLENHGKSSAKIIWDESVLVDTKGKTHRVIHEGVKFANSGDSMPPTLVPSGAKIEDLLAYADGVSYNSYTKSWDYTELVPCSTPGAICSNDDHLGKFLTLLLMVEVDGKKQEYTAKLKIRKAD